MSAPTKLRIWYFLTVSVQISIRAQFSCIFHSAAFPQLLSGIWGKTKHEMAFPYGVKKTPTTIQFKWRERCYHFLVVDEEEQNVPTSDPHCLETTIFRQISLILVPQKWWSTKLLVKLIGSHCRSVKPFLMSCELLVLDFNLRASLSV